ncbi:MAG: proton-conducting transporter membrane subunit [bacterium]
METLFFSGLTLQLTALAFAVAIKNQKESLVLTQTVLILGLILSIIPIASSLFTTQAELLAVPSGMLRFDGLSKFFLLIIQLTAIPITIYNISYFKSYTDRGISVKNYTVPYILLIVSTQLIVISNHAILFLVFWEAMTVTSYLGITFEKEDKEVQRGSFYYLAASHAMIFILYIAFFLLHKESGSWFFTDFLVEGSSLRAALIFILSLTAFGIKAGFIPFHFWLPRAHPIAPTPLSAFLSGVIIKLGIYGIMRTVFFLSSIEEWMGWIVLIVSMVSAIFGVWYALAQHDIKKLLAYCSVENIGVIGLGIGIGLIGAANHSVPIQVLGFGGALLHTLNHAIFKSLLFTGSGVIYKNLKTRNIELMGGIVHHSKAIVILFLIGSVAISGVPPLNGFVSELVLFKGFFVVSNELKSDYSLAMLVSVVGLALVGGLAAACFTKLNSIMLLGAERKKIDSFKVSLLEYFSLGYFAFFSILIGVFPQPLLNVVGKILLGNDAVVGGSPLFSIKWSYITLISIALIVSVTVLYLLRKIFTKLYGRRRSAAWGCGYTGVTPKMQYTASSFVDELNTIPKALLVYEKQINDHTTVFPVTTEFHSGSSDFIDTKIVLKSFKKFTSFVSKFDYFNVSDVRYYVGFILFTIAVYGVIAYFWS